MSYTDALPGLANAAINTALGDVPDHTALENDAFPFEALSDIAELESWRKEVNRPIYHLHKWWAQRLGSVFRGVLIGALERDPSRVIPAFYEPSRYDHATVFDPFMGSGTTVGEALKLGMRGVGRDINPVAAFTVRTALAIRSQETILKTFQALEREIAPVLQHYYRAIQPDGSVAKTLYYFWVKVVPCPVCDHAVDLFSSYVFAKHAYAARVPAAQILCPSCGEVQQARYDSTEITCCSCRVTFNPQRGPAKGQKAQCPNCCEEFAIAQAVRRHSAPPAHRMYAKLVLRSAGTKAYQGITAEDLALYDEATAALAQRPSAYPLVAIQPGNNTNQVLAYQYHYWHQMFNARQLLCLSLLAEKIMAIKDRSTRHLFICLFSGSLEFNNMFASFKGEGTGAVRHMFAHHILKPERTPLEANLWGTPKSSGAFSTLFRSRLMRAMEYRDAPFEVRPVRGAGEKLFGLSAPMGREIAATFEEFSANDNSVYLSCGDSASTDLPDNSVELIVTDPPFFDNVHYSELADFFHVWQRKMLHCEGERISAETTRAAGEVQSNDADTFARRLQGVFAECRRVLRPRGLLVFSYHHSRADGWQSVLAALHGAGFVLTATQPITAEMSVATPKAQAKEPISLDIIMVCRPRDEQSITAPSTYEMAIDRAEQQAERFRVAGRALSRNDLRVIIMAQLLRAAKYTESPQVTKNHLAEWESRIGPVVEQLHALQGQLSGRQPA